MPDFVGAVDQGTTSTRFMVFDHGGNERGKFQLEHEQILPQAGWVEHNPVEIRERTETVVRTVVNQMGLSASDLAAPVLVVSQFTLYGDARQGRRPTWEAAAPAPVSEPLYEAVCAALRGLGADVSTGVFGAHMEVASVNQGPFTVLLER